MTLTNRILAAVLVAWVGASACAGEGGEKKRKTENVILVTLDGMRWQEVFGGFDPLIATENAGGVKDVKALKEAFERPSAEESREAIFPFLWGTVSKKGQIFGDRGVKNVGRVTNLFRFSYPGYNELLTGFFDPRIDSNKNVPNPNVTVLEWLNGRPGFEGKVAAYGAWARLKAIVNPGRSKLPVVAGWDPIEPFFGAELTEREKAINDLLAHSTRHWRDEPPDDLIEAAAMEYLVKHTPRVFFIMLGETDEWAHGRRYDLYLESAKGSDDFIRRLWEKVQGMPQYAGKTTLIVTTDHGRGMTPADWINHDLKVPGSEGWWAAVMGPDTPATGVRGEGEETQSQIAATIAALLGEDWNAAEARAGKVLSGVAGK